MLKTIYKYLPPREQFFDNFLLRASSRFSLNDPFETTPSISCLTDLCLKDPYGSFDTLSSEDLNQLFDCIPIESRWDSIGHQMCKDRGIISLSETKDNLLMWSHYAKEHQGIVVEFEAHDPFFSSDYVNSAFPLMGKVSRVLYRKERIAELSSNDISEIFFHKSDEWMYEKEVRLLLPLIDSDQILLLHQSSDNVEDLLSDLGLEEHNIEPYGNFLKIVDRPPYLSDHFDNPNFMFMFQVPKRAIKSITFGVNVSDKFKHKVIEKVRNDNELNVNLFQARTDYYDYRLRFDALNPTD
ncbi:DUF2971 domain-containing protein [Vibrio fortis]|uniref:DUF2971 domain-containing protein n=1 Tax=Vibrio fortis TaxID=212667 RepID=UPI0036F1FC6C